MKIKEVEKRTGLSAKSIRMYEAKGLLDVKRLEENDYRDYTEENVTELKKVKVLRYLEFSLDEIFSMKKMDKETLRQVFSKKADQLENQRDSLEIKRDLCRRLGKEGEMPDQMVDEYKEAIDCLEDPEINEALEALRELGCPNIYHMLLYSLILSGPIMWLFINISEQKWDILIWNAAFALIGAAVIGALWVYYFQQRSLQPNRVKKRNKENRHVIPAMILGIVLTIVLAVFLFSKVEVLLAPKGWLFYQMSQAAEFGLIFLLEIPVLYCLLEILKNGWKKEKKTPRFGFLRRYWYLVIPMWLVCFYLCFFSVTYVTQDQIICHTPFCPQGKEYLYEEVTSVKTGFGQKMSTISPKDRRGTFSYSIRLGEKEIVLTQPSVNEDIPRYLEHTYLELEEFDQALMELGVQKEGTEAGYQYCDLDEEYVERFRRIIRNRAQ